MRRFTARFAFLFVLLILFGCGGGSTNPKSPVVTANPITPNFSKTEPDFTIVALPDTQSYTNSPTIHALFKAQTDWIAANKDSLNIVGVLGLGDIVNCGIADEAQFQLADAAYAVLDQAGIPYAPMLGNHDISVDCRGIAGPPRETSLYNKYFGPARLQKYPWYGASTYPAGSNENFYLTIDRQQRKYLVVAVEFKPRPEAFAWANSVIDQFPDREVIIITHAYLNADATIDGESNDLWGKLASKHSNVIMVASGHIFGESRRTDAGDAGNIVQQVMADYQSEFNGGNAYLRIMKFRPSAGTIEVSTYSPWVNLFRTDDANQFTLQYK